MSADSTSRQINRALSKSFVTIAADLKTKAGNTKRATSHWTPLERAIVMGHVDALKDLAESFTQEANRLRSR
jgi:hypothetical protein